MRLIDADALFDSAFKVWGTEADGGETNLFMEMINDAPTISPPPNGPLTLAELREMGGEPMWLSGDELNRYDIFRGERSPGWADFYCGRFSLFCYGKGWLAYRRKPEEGTA